MKIRITLNSKSGLDQPKIIVNVENGSKNEIFELNRADDLLEILDKKSKESKIMSNELKVSLHCSGSSLVKKRLKESLSYKILAAMLYALGFPAT